MLGIHIYLPQFQTAQTWQTFRVARRKYAKMFCVTYSRFSGRLQGGSLSPQGHVVVDDVAAVLHFVAPAPTLPRVYCRSSLLES